MKTILALGAMLALALAPSLSPATAASGLTPPPIDSPALDAALATRNIANPVTSPAATTPTGTESISCVQGGVAKGCTTGSVASFVAAPVQATVNAARIGTPATVMANGNNPANAAGGWQASNPVASVQIMTTDNTFTRRGVPTQKIDATMTTGAFYRTYRIAFAKTATCTGPITAWVYSPAATNGLSIQMNWSSDAPASDPPTVEATNEYNLSFIADGFLPGAWSALSVSGPSGKIFGPDYLNGVAVSTTGSPVAGTIKQASLIVSFNTAVPAAQRLLWIDDIECGGKLKVPNVVIGFDGANDTTTSWANKTLPLIANNIPFYLAGDGNSFAAGVVTNPSMVPLSQGGYIDIISQGMNHLDYGANPTTLLTDFPQSLALIAAAGLVPQPALMAYPFNSRNVTTDANAAAVGIKCARTSLGNSRIPYGTTGTISALAIPAWDIDNTTAVQDEAVIVEAEASGTDLVFYGHAVTTAAGSSTNKVLSEYTTLIPYLVAEAAAGRINLVKFSTECRSIGGI